MSYSSGFFLQAWRDCLHADDPIDTARVFHHALNNLVAGYEGAAPHLVNWNADTAADYLEPTEDPFGTFRLVESFGPVIMVGHRERAAPHPIFWRLAVTQTAPGDVDWAVVPGPSPPPWPSPAPAGVFALGSDQWTVDASAGVTEGTGVNGSVWSTSGTTRTHAVPRTLGGTRADVEFFFGSINVFARSDVEDVGPKIVAFRARQAA